MFTGSYSENHMRNLKRLVLAFAFLASGGVLGGCNGKDDRPVVGPDAAAPLSPAETRTEVQAAVKAYADMLNRADVSAVLELYDRGPSVTSVGDGEITRGWESIRTEVDSTLTGLQGAFSASLGSIDVTPLGSAHALAVAPYTITVTSSSGPLQMRGAMSLVLQRTDSKWVIVHEHSSTVAVTDN